MPLTYPDQNTVIGLGHKARDEEFRRKLDSAIGAGLVSFVVSLWHLIETAHTSNLINAIELAEFIDSLRPAWLLERIDIQKLDVEEDFYRFLGLDHACKPRVTSRSAVVAALNNAKDAARFDLPSPRFVKGWVTQPQLLRNLEQAYGNNANSLIRLRQLVKSGKVTEELRKRVNEILVRISTPATTPAGVHVGREVKLDYVKQVRIGNISSIAIETAISEVEWLAQGGADRNTLIDKFHLISALPYVDEIVSDDHFFWKIYPATLKTGHVKAKLLNNMDFLKRF